MLAPRLLNGDSRCGSGSLPVEEGDADVFKSWLALGVQDLDSESGEELIATGSRGAANF